MKATIAVIPRILLVISASLAPLLAQTPGTQQQQPEFIRQGQQLMREGKLDDALALYRKTLQTLPNSVPANIAAGSVLDLEGQGEEGRRYFAKAIEIADTPEHKAMAQRAMAISYAFEGNCGKTVEYEQQVFEYYGNAKNFFQQGEIADEAARVCIDSDDLHNRYPADDLDTAFQWYQLGHDTGMKEPDIQPARQDLWDFRWEHAQARVAARRGNQAEAQKHVAPANSILDKGTNPEQAQFLPYLKGYVAFYGKEYKTALDELLKANQNDPFIQCMIGQTYEKLGDKDKAIEFYRKASTAIAHNPPLRMRSPSPRRSLLRCRTSLLFSTFPFKSDNRTVVTVVGHTGGHARNHASGHPLPLGSYYTCYRRRRHLNANHLAGNALFEPIALLSNAGRYL